MGTRSESNIKLLISAKMPISIVAIVLLLSITSKVMALRGQPIIVTSNISPHIVRVNGKVVTYYEIGLKNNSTKPVTINLINIFLGKSDRMIKSFTGLKLDAQLSKGTGRFLRPRQKVFLYVELALPPLLKSQHYLNHVVSYTINNIGYQCRLKLTLDSGRPIILHPPLGLGYWAAIYNPKWERGHRRVFFTTDKKSRIPGRYAVDFIKLENNGHQADGDEDSIKNWHGYGADVLAVGDGQVIAAVDTAKESKTLSTYVKVDSSRAAGNHIVLKLQDHVFAFYEHLKPGSVLVKPGDFVKSGQVIGRLGFTGQSTGPHLHFHLANDSTPLGAEGIPYVFKAFYYRGFYKDFEDFSHKRWTDAPSKVAPRLLEFPMSNTVIEFNKQPQRK